jgi:hypothetical protein
MKRLVSFAAVGAAGLNLFVGAAHAARPDASACFRDLYSGRGADITCQFPVRPNAAELADLRRQSRGFVTNANCMVSIRIDRAQVLAAIETPDHVFQAAPQPVTCEVTTKLRDVEQVLPITGAFAPRVTIRNGIAVDATPGLRDVKGVSRALSLPVELWVNSGGYMKTGMMQVINAWLDHLKKDLPKRSASR